MNVFYRMTSRRELPEEIYSDNGTNFKGADNELESLVAQVDEGQIKQSIANKAVKWISIFLWLHISADDMKI